MTGITKEALLKGAVVGIAKGNKDPNIVKKNQEMMEQALANVKDFNSEEWEKKKVEIYNNTIGDLQGYNCDKCKNKGYIMLENGKMRLCECMDIRTTQRMLINSGLADKVKSLTFKNFEVKEEWQQYCKNVCANFCKNGTGWLYFGGQSGCGKTHLCTAVTGYFIKKKIRTKYMLWRDEVVELKQLVTDMKMYQAKINLLKTVPLLYIDDFLKTQQGQAPTQADINIAYEILNYRYNKKLLTIISTELQNGELIKIDEATAGRIIEMCGDNLINVSKDINKNYRLKKFNTI